MINLNPDTLNEEQRSRYLRVVSENLGQLVCNRMTTLPCNTNHIRHLPDLIKNTIIEAWDLNVAHLERLNKELAAAVLDVSTRDVLSKSGRNNRRVNYLNDYAGLLHDTQLAVYRLWQAEGQNLDDGSWAIDQDTAEINGETTLPFAT